MPRTGVKFPELKAYTNEINAKIQLINGDPGLTPEEKKAAIKGLEGLTREKMIEITRRHFSRGTELSNYVNSLNPKGEKKTIKSLFSGKKTKKT